MTFDYVVVGSGSSGAVIAARLSEDPANQVLLLEAGPADNSPWIGVPLGFARVLANPKYSWPFASEPEKELGDRSFPMARGKVLGGSSSVNGMIYIRGLPYDYNLWRQMGATGWSYDEVLPFFRRAEQQSRGEDAYHGTGGPLSVEDVRWRTPLSEAFIGDSEAAGIKRSDDFCREDIEGVGYFQTTTRKGRRASTARAYLKSARRRTNLHIVLNSTVDRIEFEGRIASAVRYVTNGEPGRVLVRKEIILSAGALNSPQILERSGIGAPEVLKKAGIAVIHQLDGVGSNLMEHLLIKRSYITKSSHTLNAIMANPILKIAAGLRYLIAKDGPLAAGPAPAGGMACTRPGLPAPDINFLFHPFEVNNFGTDLAPESSFQISFFPVRPESRGQSHVVSADYRQLPRIAPNFLTTPDDVRTVLDGLRLIGRIGRGQALSKLGAREVLPGLKTESDETLLDYVRGNASPAFHSAGTCRMGNDALAVVDPDLRVRGVSRLRVADASIMPTMPSGGLNAACIMIGEKCVDILRREK